MSGIGVFYPDKRPTELVGIRAGKNGGLEEVLRRVVAEEWQAGSPLANHQCGLTRGGSTRVTDFITELPAGIH